MVKIFKNKFVIIMLLVVLFFFFGSITNTLVLNNRGIVVGMGLDCTEDGKVVLNCQILVAGATGAEGEENDNYAILTAEGRTFGEATQRMLVDSAEYMSFAHCNSIIVGKSMAESGKLFVILDELLKNSKITENTNLVYYDGKSLDMLKQKVGINLMASFAIQRMVSLSKGYVNVASCSIKDYMVGVKRTGGAVVMPEVVVSEKIEEAIGSEQGKGRVVLSLKGGACLSGDGVVLRLTEEEVGYYNIVAKDFKLGTFSMDTPDGVRSLEFRDKSSDFTHDVEGVLTTCKIDARVIESLYINDVEGRDDDEKEIIAARFEQGVKEGIESIYSKCKEMGADIFEVYGGFSKKYGKKFEIEHPNFSEEFILKVEVEAEIAP